MSRLEQVRTCEKCGKTILLGAEIIDGTNTSCAFCALAAAEQKVSDAEGLERSRGRSMDWQRVRKFMDRRGARAAREEAGGE